MVERVLDLDVAAAAPNDRRELALEIECCDTVGRIKPPSWPTSVLGRRMNMLGCLGTSRPVSDACER